MNRSFTIADQLHAIIYRDDGRASVPTIEVDIDEITEVETVCSCRRHTGRHPVVATRRLHARQ
jgi:hypothetical protein